LSLSLPFDEERGLFWDLAGRDHTPLKVSTWSSLAPLALPSLPEEIADRLIEEQLLDPDRYRARYGIPSVSMEEPSFRAGWHHFRCRRGPSWINTIWLPAPALRRFGYEAEAERLLSWCLELVERNGFREYYNPGGVRSRRAVGPPLAGGDPSAADISSSAWFSASLILRLPPMPRKLPSLWAPATACATVITKVL
jgi:Mannosylglycerate hydrolase MGH1-like glycoside hydrolase domain